MMVMALQASLALHRILLVDRDLFDTRPHDISSWIFLG